MADPFISEIKLFAGIYAPAHWAFCNGQIMPISQNEALASLLGATFGGDGRTTFGLPDMRGRVPMHFGQGPGLSQRVMGQMFGTETVTLTEDQMPSHIHLLEATKNPGTTSIPQNAVVAKPSDGQPFYADGDSGGVDKVKELEGTPLQTAGSGNSHTNMMPYLAVTYIIALQGTYPSRN
jgi:microcystin-dependent protein